MQPSLLISGVRTVTVFATLLSLLGLAAAAVWVYEDAHDRGRESPLLVAFGTVFLPFLLPAYVLFAAFGWMGERSSQPSTRERVAGTFGFGVVLAFVAGSTLSPPDPLSAIRYTAVALLPALAVAYVLTGRVGRDDSHKSRPVEADP